MPSDTSETEKLMIPPIFLTSRSRAMVYESEEKAFATEKSDVMDIREVMEDMEGSFDSDENREAMVATRRIEIEEEEQVREEVPKKSLSL